MEENISTRQTEKIDSDSSINFRWFFATLLGVWPWFLISIIIALSVGQIYLRYTTPIYASAAEVILNDTKRNDASVLEGIGVNTGKATMENEIRVLKSRILMVEVVKELKLYVSYLVSGRLKTTELYKDSPFNLDVLMPDVETGITKFYSFKIKYIDGKHYILTDNGKQSKHAFGDTVMSSVGNILITANPLKQVDMPDDEYTVVVSPLGLAAAKFGSGLNVSSPNKNSSTLNIFLSDEIAARASDIVNELIQLYIRENINDRNRISDNTIAFIEDRLRDVSGDLSGVEGEIEGFKRNNEIIDIGSKGSMLMSNANQKENTVQDKMVELELVKNIEKYVNDKKGVPGSVIVQDGTISGNLDKLNNALLEKQKLLLTTTESNPIVKNLDLQIDNARENLLISLATKKSELQFTINQLQKQASNLGSEIRTVPSKERIFLEYTRQQNIKQELYLYLLKKREETAIAKSSTVSNIKIVDPASPSSTPLSPNRSKVMYIAFICGLLVPGLGLYIRRAVNTRVISKLDISKQTNIPILGEIGHYNEAQPIAVKNNSRSALAEQFRALRTNLQFLLTDKSHKTILLTSTMSGEGKSFIAINLASTFAISGKKVALLEFDLRKPKISSNLGIDNGIGFSTYAIGKAEIDEIIKPSEILDNFFVIPSGPVPPNPAELIMLQRTEELFAELKERFDYIIIDTAPLGLVTDAQLLGKFADATLYVVRQAYTFKHQIQIPQEVYANNKLSKMSIIVNDVKQNLGFLYGYGYGYGYGGYGYSYGYGYGYGNGYGYGSYGNGYFQEDKKKGIKGLLKNIKK